jgi:hypothetical protein
MPGGWPPDGRPPTRIEVTREVVVAAFVLGVLFFVGAGRLVVWLLEVL